MNCGAPIDLTKLSCDFCGADSKENAGESYEIFINRFTEKLQFVTTDEAKELALSSAIGKTKLEELSRTSAFINTLYIPENRNQLIQLVAFLTGQLHSSSQSLTLINLKEKGIVVSSWIGKAYEVSAKLQLMSIEDTKLKAAVSLIDDHIKKAEMRLSITKRNE